MKIAFTGILLRNDSELPGFRNLLLFRVLIQVRVFSQNHYYFPESLLFSRTKVSPSLSCRWCSAYLKVDVLDKVLCNDPFYRGKRVLVISGERAEESASRAKYATFEPGRAHAPKIGRHVDHWRPIHGMKEDAVWNLMQRHGIVPHPAYRLGWGRLSCLSCIFGTANQWASVRKIAPSRFDRIESYETAFGVTIDRKVSVGDKAARGYVYPALSAQPDLAALAMRNDYSEVVKVEPHEWELPAGACGEKSGPT